jgi:hypothetical protein
MTRLVATTTTHWTSRLADDPDGMSHKLVLDRYVSISSRLIRYVPDRGRAMTRGKYGRTAGLDGHTIEQPSMEGGD